MKFRDHLYTVFIISRDGLQVNKGMRAVKNPGTISLDNYCNFY